jgi:hypothetical protein
MVILSAERRQRTAETTEALETHDRFAITAEIPLINADDSLDKAWGITIFESNCPPIHVFFLDYQAPNPNSTLQITRNIVADAGVAEELSIKPLPAGSRIFPLDHLNPYGDIKSCAVVLPDGYPETDGEWSRIGEILFNDLQLQPVDGTFEAMRTHALGWR